MNKLIFLLLLPLNAHSGAYIDIGAAFIEQIRVSEVGTLESPTEDYRASQVLLIPVEETAPMIRLGYKYDGFAFEVDYIGESDIHFNRANLFYRFEF